MNIDYRITRLGGENVTHERTQLMGGILNARGVHVVDIQLEEGDKSMFLTTSKPLGTDVAKYMKDYYGLKVVELTDKLPDFVLKNWVGRLPYMAQGCLMAAVRGPDSVPAEGPYKLLCRAIRNAVFKTARPEKYAAAKTKFFNIESTPDRVKLEEGWTDHLPTHPVMHLMHACEVLGYKYPDVAERQVWFEIYAQIAHSFHLNIETEEQMDARLTDER